MHTQSTPALAGAGISDSVPNGNKSYFCAMPDNARLHELLQDDEQAFMELLFKSFFPLVCKTIYRLVQDTATAEDLAQEVFIRIWNRRSALQEVYFKAYLHRAAINMALDHLDKHKRQGKHLSIEEDMIQLPASSGTAESPHRLKQTTAHIHQAIDRLPEKCREIFILSRFEEMTYREIAATLNISVKTVENQMITALKKLRVSLQDYLAVILLVACSSLYLLLLQF
ncbi:MAG TPA: RNA polymerase sigma-70 factor [Chitinophaga sp.]|uniref:RNA polymerase sigma factor n=1 Tax=Chitinophaga sp. TaxID=1869181 RepID=UPI002F951F88